jgi:hypothetical protein
MFLDPSLHLEFARQREGVLLASAPARELAQRLSGTDEVLLLWYPENERVELAVRDLTTGVGFHLDVAPSCAIDAFYHPYVYAAGREDPDCVVRPEPRRADG